jgi:hypothetical protein
MSDEPLLHQLGAFSPEEASQLVPLLEAQHIAFEVETDESALSGSNDFPGLLFGVNPEGAKILIFVPEPALAPAQEILAKLFPG